MTYYAIDTIAIPATIQLEGKCLEFIKNAVPSILTYSDKKEISNQNIKFVYHKNMLSIINCLNISDKQLKMTTEIILYLVGTISNPTILKQLSDLFMEIHNSSITKMAEDLGKQQIDLDVIKSFISSLSLPK